MFVTDPNQQATIREVLMIKGFNSPPENYLPVRNLLTTPLDLKVIHTI